MLICCTDPVTVDWSLQGQTVEADVLYDVAVDINDDIYIVGSATFNSLNGPDFSMFKFTSSSEKLWEWSDGTEASDVLLAVLLPSENEVIAVGYSEGNYAEGFNGNGLSQPVIVQFSSSGSVQYAKQFSTISNIHQYNLATIDTSGHIFISGRDQAGGAYVFKFQHLNGVLLDTYEINTPVSSINLLFNDNNNLYIFGSSDAASFYGHTSAGGADGFVLKMSDFGTVDSTYFISTAGQDIIYDMAVGTDDSMYVVGSVSSTASEFYGQPIVAGFSDGFIAKVASNGTVLWAHLIDTEGIDIVYAVILDHTMIASENPSLYATARLGGSYQNQTHLGFQDCALVHLTGDGALSWVYQYGTIGGDIARALALSRVGKRIYVVGWSNAAFLGGTHIGDFDMIFTKFTLTGNVNG